MVTDRKTATVILAVCAFLASRLLEAKGLTWATDVTTIASFVLAAVIPIVPFVGKLLGWLHGDPRYPRSRSAGTCRFCARARQAVDRRDKTRRVHDPWPLLFAGKLVATAAEQVPTWALVLGDPGDARLDRTDPGFGRDQADAGDVTLIAVRPLGFCWSCYAVQALIRPGLTAFREGKDRWLRCSGHPVIRPGCPVPWYRPSPVFLGTGWNHGWPLGWDGKEVWHSTRLHRRSRRHTYYSRSPPHGRPPAVLVLAGLFALAGWTGWAALAVITEIVFIMICFSRLRRRLARRNCRPAHGHCTCIPMRSRLPAAAEASGLRRKTSRVSNFIRSAGTPRVPPCMRGFAPETAARLGASDGWFPLYWGPDLSTKIPAELVISLAVFASGRLNGSLRREATRARNSKAPVYRRLQAYGLFR